MDKKILITHYGNIKRIAMDHCKMVDNGRKEKRKCLWICGEPGTGKTRYVHEQYPNHYKKKANKWFNGY